MDKETPPANHRKSVTVAFRTDPATRHLIEAVALRKGILMADWLREITLRALADALSRGSQ